MTLRYNLICRDEQNTGAFFIQSPSIHKSIMGKAPLMCGHMSSAVHLDNDGAREGRFVVSPIRRRLTPHKKQNILERDGFMCVYCGGDATVVDHIIPWDWRHNDDPINLVASCETCNSIAHDFIFDGLFEKAKYIRGQRNLSKWKRRDSRKLHVNICIDCKSYFRLCVNGATNFLCPRCASKARGEKL